MGFRYRGKTSGKDAWINYSVSSKGIKASTSFKVGDDMTVNVGKDRTRTTFNLGDGLTYVADRPHKKATKTVAKKPYVNTTPSKYNTMEEIDAADREFMQKIVWPFVVRGGLILFTLILMLSRCDG